MENEKCITMCQIQHRHIRWGKEDIGYENVPMISGWSTVDIANMIGDFEGAEMMLTDSEAVEYLNTLCSPDVLFLLDDDCLVLESITEDCL